MKTLLPTLIFALFLTLTLHAQEGAGRTYLLAFPDTTTNTFDARFPNECFADRALIYIYSSVDNRVRISGKGYERIEELRAGTFAVVDLLDSAHPAPDPIVTRSNVVASNSFRLDADEPVIVYCFLLTRFGSEAWTPLPVASWGKEYLVAARPGEVARDVGIEGRFILLRKAKMAPAEITIIAAYDSTRVTIASAGDLLDAAREIDVMLDAGEIYQVQSLVDTSVHADMQPDIGGSRVTATKPIAVLAGNTRARALHFQEGWAQNSFKNMLVEWLSPVHMHGREFVYLPTIDGLQPTGAPGENLFMKRRGEQIRIYASSPGAMAGYSLDNNIGRTDFSIAAAGEFREELIGTPEPRYYSLDQPGQVMMNSTPIVYYSAPGDTFVWGGYQGAEFHAWSAYMAELIPRHRWSSFTPLYAPAMSDSMWHYIDVVTDSTHRNDVYVENGQRFDFNKGTIDGTGLIWGTMEVAPGVLHYLEGRNGARFSGHVYGLWRGREEHRPGGYHTATDSLGEYEEYLAVSYGYPFSSRHIALSSAVENERSIDAPGVVIHPNPLSGSATISFRTESPGDATLLVTDASGAEVMLGRIENLSAGEQSIQWDASELASGIYHYRLRASSFDVSGSIVVVR